MNAAIKLDGQRRLKAEEVYDECSHRNLSPPLPAFEPAGAQRVPQPGFRLGLIAP
jgi:hypothetical protein